MSIRDQERREQQAMRRAAAVERRIKAREQESVKRANEVVRRIDEGDVSPRERPANQEEPSDS